MTDDEYEKMYHEYMYDLQEYEAYLQSQDYYNFVLRQMEARDAMQEFRGLDKEEEE